VAVVRLATIFLVACSFEPGVAPPPGVDADASGDADSGALCTTWPSRHFDACAIPMPTEDVHLIVADGPYVYDTTTGGG